MNDLLTKHRRKKMINDVTVNVTYTNVNNEIDKLQLTLTGKQIEQTFLRRIATLLPTAKNVVFEPVEPKVAAPKSK